MAKRLQLLFSFCLTSNKRIDFYLVPMPDLHSDAREDSSSSIINSADGETMDAKSWIQHIGQWFLSNGDHELVTIEMNESVIIFLP